MTYLVMKDCIFVKNNNGKGTFKLIDTLNLRQLGDAKFNGTIKNVSVDYQDGLWLVGYLNTQAARNDLGSWARELMEGNFQISNQLWHLCRIPDEDYFKKHHPIRHKAYKSWVENNIHDYQAFCAGIDKQFGKLINSI